MKGFQLIASSFPGLGLAQSDILTSGDFLIFTLRRVRKQLAIFLNLRSSGLPSPSARRTQSRGKANRTETQRRSNWPHDPKNSRLPCPGPSSLDSGKTGEMDRNSIEYRSGKDCVRLRGQDVESLWRHDNNSAIATRACGGIRPPLRTSPPDGEARRNGATVLNAGPSRSMAPTARTTHRTHCRAARQRTDQRRRTAFGSGGQTVQSDATAICRGLSWPPSTVAPSFSSVAICASL